LSMRKALVVLVVLVVVGLLLLPGTDKTPVIAIDSGELQGEFSPDTGIASFKGVPYAAAPVDGLRWQPPQATVPWSDVLQADSHGPNCVQSTEGLGGFLDLMMDGVGLAQWKRWVVSAGMSAAAGGSVSEDCLTLALYAPMETAEPLPVMVWYHGGGHQFGAGDAMNYDASLLAQRGVVVVSINYRLGVFGFFAHPELSAESPHGSSGNYGTLDQIFALQWVRDNIAAFGGDPDNVTIFGESAGAHSVGQVMASPLAAGLFHKGIAQSGIGTHNFLPLQGAEESGENMGLELARELGLEGDKQLTALRGLDAQQINDTFVAGSGELFGLSHPVVDGWVFPQATGDSFASASQAQVPLMIGTNADEGTLLAPLFGSPFIGHLPPQNVAEYEAMVQEVYPDSAEQVLALYPVHSDEDLFQAINNLFGDHFFGMQAWFAANEMSRQGLPTWLYFFTRTSPVPEQWAGAYHGADIQFVFGGFFPLFPKNDFDDGLADTMMDYWTNFARSGDPNGEGLPAWAGFDSNDPQELELGRQVKMQPVARRHNYELLVTDQWKKLKSSQ
jgi:para-nitrobenzyl esterase